MPSNVEDLLRELTPQVLGALVRRSGDFDAAEDAVQEALLAAALHWPRAGVPANPRGWLVQTAARRLIDQRRSEQSRRHRESLALQQEAPTREVSDQDDTLIVFLPDNSEVTGLLALMLLIDARRPARTNAAGELIPLAEQDRTLWDQALIAEGVALINRAVGKRGGWRVPAPGRYRGRS